MVDLKLDKMNSKLTELAEENAKLKSEYKKSKRFIMSKFGDNAVMNPMQKAFVECVDMIKKDIEKRRALNKVPFDREAGSPKNATQLPKFMSLEQFLEQDKIKLMHHVFNN